MKFLIGYMILSSASLLGLLGDYMGSVAIQVYQIPIDMLSYTFIMYNFAVVGVIAIFYQNGVPTSITQGYLVCTSVILAWHFSHFDDWTAWTLLVMLALYDLCAVLTPCGPLKALVNLMQDEDAPDMPGLLYEAQLPSGTQKPGRPKNENSAVNGNENRTSRSSAATRKEGTRSKNSGGESHRGRDSNTNSSAQLPPPAASASASTVESESASPLTNGPRIFVPLVIAKVYRLPLVSRYTHVVSASTSGRGQRKKSSRRKRNKSNSSTINESPLLAEKNNEETLEEFYQREFSVSELKAEVEVQLPPDGGWIEKLEGNDNRFLVYGKNGNVKRELYMNKKGKVYDVTDDDDEDSVFDDEPSSIRLGLVSNVYCNLSWKKYYFVG